MYSPKTIDHFSHPRNMGQITDFDLKAEGGNPLCGDVVKLWIKLSADKKKIADIKFKAFGCGACIAASSALTEMSKGLAVTKARKITREDVSKYLDSLPESKIKCSGFSVDVLKKALAGA
jgi:nitrogen fixation protein NifU and related proteins